MDLQKYPNGTLCLLRYKKVHFLKRDCPGGTQLPDLQQLAAFLSPRDPAVTAAVEACRKRCPDAWEAGWPCFWLRWPSPRQQLVLRNPGS